MNDLYSLQNLFNGKIFRIPDYQRGYSWNFQQLNEFWEDLNNIPSGREHYTGMISLKKINNTTGEKWNDEQWLINERSYVTYHIVDGQQRLTTFIVLINEIVEFYRNLPENNNKTDEQIFINSFSLKSIVEDYLYIIKPDSYSQIKTYKFGYEVDNPSYMYFKNKIVNRDLTSIIDETFYTLNLQFAQDFFKENLLNLYNESHSSDVISKLFFNLTQKLKFNLYYIDDDFNVFIAFETMNNRGKRLSNLELLKNRLIYLTTLFECNEDLRYKTRTKINDTWKIVYEYIGKNKEKALNDDEFLQAHWVIYFGYSRSTKDSYTNFLLNNYFIQKRVLNLSQAPVYYIQENDGFEMEDDELQNEETQLIQDISINNKEKLTIGDIGNYIDSMSTLIPYWYMLHFPDKSNFSKNIKVWLEKLNRINFAYFKPLVCVVLADDSILEDDKLKCLQLIERWIFLHFRLSAYFQTYQNSYFYNLARDLYNKKKSIDDIFIDLNNIVVLDENNCLDINSAVSRFTKLFKNGKGYYSWASTRYVLYEYEVYLTKSVNGVEKILPTDIFKKDEKDKISIEHIYPQTDDKPYWIERFSMYDPRSQFNLSNSLGNLLPLSMSINSSFQNDSFDDKKNGTNTRERCYANGSYSEMKVAKYDEWTSETIKNRGLDMLSFMEKRWNFKFKSQDDKLRLLFLNDLIIDENKNIIVKNDNQVEDSIEKKDSIVKNNNKTQNFIKEIDRLKNGSSSEVIDMFERINEYIFSLNSSITYSVTKNYISYRIGKSFVEIYLMSNFIKMILMAGDYDDPKSKVVKLGNNYNWVNNMRLDVYNSDELNYAKNIIYQSYRKVER